MARPRTILLLAIVGICHWLLFWLIKATPFDTQTRRIALPLVACVSVAALIPMLIQWRGGKRAAILPLLIYPLFVLGDMIKMWLSIGGHAGHEG
jgi:hypothetical protein